MKQNLNKKPIVKPVVRPAVRPIARKSPKPKSGAKFLTRIVELSGVQQGYSATVAWFTERVLIASFALAVLSFAAGTMFVLELSEPIGESQIYNAAARRTALAEEGIKEFSQQVIDVASPVFADLIKANREEEEPEVDVLAVRKDKLRSYLKEKKSPFAEDEEALDAFVNSRNMKLMVAISFVESTFGKNCYYYNCSGIGGTPPKLRKYNNYAEWIRDFDDLLERRYKNVPPEDFIGLYVQPGSPNWIYGVKQVIREFEEQGIEV